MSADTLAVLLAAGPGTRLRPLTQDRPKCLLELAGRTLLDYQLAALAAHGIEDVLVVTGHCADQIVSRYPRRIRTLHNPDYAATNNLHSLWTARHELAGRDTLCLHTDLLFHPAILRPCLEHPAEVCVALDPELVEETMKARVENHRVVEISKNIPPDKMFATFPGIARFSPRASALLPAVLDSLVKEEANRHAYFTACLPPLTARGCQVGYSLTRALPWIEIDSPADLERAQKETLPSLLPVFAKLPGLPFGENR